MLIFLLNIVKNVKTKMPLYPHIAIFSRIKCGNLAPSTADIRRFQPPPPPKKKKKIGDVSAPAENNVRVKFEDCHISIASLVNKKAIKKIVKFPVL